MDFEDDDFLDAIDEDDLYEEISKLKICLEEKSMIVDTLTFQLAEREKHNEKLECEMQQGEVNRLTIVSKGIKQITR